MVKRTFNIPDDLDRKIDEKAKEMRVTKTDLLIEAITFYLKHGAKLLRSSDERNPWIRYTLRYSAKCVNCGRKLNAGVNVMWNYLDKKALCFKCYRELNRPNDSQILSEICERLVSIDGQLYCLHGEGKRKKLLDIIECEVCKAIHAKKTIENAKPAEKKPYKVILRNQPRRVYFHKIYEDGFLSGLWIPCKYVDRVKYPDKCMKCPDKDTCLIKKDADELWGRLAK
ncbi:hypothetical protein DRO58_02515 [Candidatus Bathyarchaeota archaeon]|nr:MAG: hypothetical protein DRO58_02515 [Candidatus Bathyarchaeota archaeon]